MVAATASAFVTAASCVFARGVRSSPRPDKSTGGEFLAHLQNQLAAASAPFCLLRQRRALRVCLPFYFVSQRGKRTVQLYSFSPRVPRLPFQTQAPAARPTAECNKSSSALLTPRQWWLVLVSEFITLRPKYLVQLNILPIHFWLYYNQWKRTGQYN